MLYFLVGGFIWWHLGIVAGSFGVIQIMIILFFEIPTSIRLRRQGILISNAPIYKHLVSLVIISAIFAGFTAGVHYFFPKYAVFYWIGIAITFFMGLGQVGGNKNNLDDYLKANERYIAPEHRISLSETTSDVSAD